jgi:GT2 family glycosyltransferase
MPMTPVLGIPIINRFDKLERLIDSIDIPVRLVVIDNSGESRAQAVVPEDGWVVDMPNGIGVPAAWNLIIKMFPTEPYWLVSNGDIAYGPGTLQKLIEATESGNWGWVSVNDHWSLYGLRSETVERVGFFDEDFAPIYCEDADYERRCDLAGIKWGSIRAEVTHETSTSLQDYRRANARTYPRNVEHYQHKWGTGVRQGGGFSTPFDRGLSVAHGPDLRRLRDAVWRRDDSTG